MRTTYLHLPSRHQSYYNSHAVITHYLKLSTTVGRLKEIHSFFLKALTKPCLYHFFSQLFKRALQFPQDNLHYARHLFDRIPNCENPFLWTSLIRSYVLHGYFSQSIHLYAEMHRRGVLPSGFTFSSVISGCARVPAIFEGKQIHARVLQSGLVGNKVVQTALIDMYSKCRSVLDAREVFDEMDERDVVAWTAMIFGYTKVGMMDDAKRLFDSMGEPNVVSWSTMVAGYANYSDMRAAKALYHEMPEKNSVTWVAMVAGYGKCGDVAEARRVFDEIVEPDAYCWAAMVACYAHNGYAEQAVEMYMVMRKQNVRITEVAMVGAISACSQLGDIEMATTLTEHVGGGCCDHTLYVSNALIHMHAKCGCMEEAQREFDKMKERDVISYSTIITALADHGKTQDVLDLFSKMQPEGIKPNEVTFIGVLSACSHGGLIEEGWKHFEMMTQVFGIKPSTEHLTCMVDLLGRAGLLEKAYDLIMQNGGASDVGIWSALLGACKVHGKARMCEIVARQIFEMEPDNTGNYVLLANTYASVHKWDDAERLRKIMQERGNRKSPGCSWILG